MDAEIYSVLGKMFFLMLGDIKFTVFLGGQYLRPKIWGLVAGATGTPFGVYYSPSMCARIYIITLDLKLFPRAFNPGRLWRTSVRLPYSQWVRSKEVHAYIQTPFFGLEIDPGS